MSRIGTEVHLDADVLAGVDQVALAEGRSRDEVIEDSVRRAVSHRMLTELLGRTRSRSTLSEDQADDLVAAERRDARRERRGGPAAQ